MSHKDETTSYFRLQVECSGLFRFVTVLEDPNINAEELKHKLERDILELYKHPLEVCWIKDAYQNDVVPKYRVQHLFRDLDQIYIFVERKGSLNTSTRSGTTTTTTTSSVSTASTETKSPPPREQKDDEDTTEEVKIGESTERASGTSVKRVRMGETERGEETRKRMRTVILEETLNNVQLPPLTGIQSSNSAGSSLS